VKWRKGAERTQERAEITSTEIMQCGGQFSGQGGGGGGGEHVLSGVTVDGGRVATAVCNFNDLLVRNLSLVVVMRTVLLMKLRPGLQSPSSWCSTSTSDGACTMQLSGIVSMFSKYDH